MCYVIITGRSILWTLLTIVTTLIIIGGVMSPYWLVGMRQKLGLKSLNESEEVLDPDQSFRPTIGIFNRCTRIHNFEGIYKRENCATFMTGYDMPDSDFPHAWKAALVFFVLAGMLMVFTMITAVISMCTRTIFGKSLFTVSGLIQSIAGLLCIIAMLLYPAGWGTQRLKNLCGEYADPYNIDNCSLGWSFYLCIIGTVLLFLCAILSIQADHSTSTRKVEQEVLEGKSLVCVL